MDVISLLFAGLLINAESLGKARFLTTMSFFHAAFEALAVNELRYLQLKEVKVSQKHALLLIQTYSL